MDGSCSIVCFMIERTGASAISTSLVSSDMMVNKREWFLFQYGDRGERSNNTSALNSHGANPECLFLVHGCEGPGFHDAAFVIEFV